MPPNKESNDWLGDLSWQGYPHLSPARDVSAAEQEPAAPRRRRGGDVRIEALARENESLRARIAAWPRLVAEFERRLSEAAQSYEGAALEAERARREVELENARLSGELKVLRTEMREFLEKINRK